MSHCNPENPSPSLFFQAVELLNSSESFQLQRYLARIILPQACRGASNAVARHFRLAAISVEKPHARIVTPQPGGHHQQKSISSDAGLAMADGTRQSSEDRVFPTMLCRSVIFVFRRESRSIMVQDVTMKSLPKPWSFVKGTSMQFFI